VKKNRVETFHIKFRRSVNVTLEVLKECSIARKRHGNALITAAQHQNCISINIMRSRFYEQCKLQLYEITTGKEKMQFISY